MNTAPCPSCHHANPDTSTFCSQCGTRLRPLATTQSTLPPEPSPVLRSAKSGFVGREHELGILQTSLEERVAGQGRTVVLLGEPGIGKTRLATEIQPYAQARGLRVLVSRCPDSEGAPPYWPWGQIVRASVKECDDHQLRTDLGVGASDIAQVIPAIRERFPDLPPSPHLEAEQERFRFFESLTTFFKNMATHQPLMLVLDDLQWADASSLLFVQYLARELHDAPVLLLTTCRESEITQQSLLSQTLAALARTPGSQALTLRRLTTEEVTQFITSTVGQTPTTEVSTAVFQRTEGHPFFMIEMVHLLATTQGMSQSLAVLPATVRSVIE